MNLAKIIFATGLLLSFLIPEVYGEVAITLNGDNPLTNAYGTPFIDPGANVSAPPLAIGAGFLFSLALKADGTVVAWGYDQYGELEILTNLTDAVAINTQAGSDYSVALKSDGTIVQWRGLAQWFGSYGEIPNGLNNVVAVTAAHEHGLALKNDGTVVAWGTDFYGGYASNDVPVDLTNVTATAAGNYYSIALKADGTLTGWGYDNNGVLDFPLGLTNVTKIVGGWAFAFALKSDGTVVGWGINLTGQMNIPPDLSNVVSVAAGYGFGLALKSDGTVVKWGWDDYIPDVSVPNGLSNVVAIAAGDYHCLALKNDGTIVSWGDDTYGETDTPSSVTNLDIPISMTGVVNPTIPGIYTLTYTATNLSGNAITATRTVVVPVPPPVIQAITQTNNAFAFSWSAISNQTYQVQFTTNLVSAVWNNLGNTVTATNSIIFTVDTNPPDAQRFYRIELLQ